MATIQAQRAGGRSSAIKQREEALKKYYENPNYCQQCGSVINVPEGGKVSETRVKKFCNHSCATAHMNRTVPIKRKQKAVKRCACGTEIKQKSTMCATCRKASARDKLGSTTKGELLSRRKGYASARATIREHAALTFSENCTERMCSACGYDKYVEVAHIKSVASFPDSATLAEINHPDNLVGLCPTHHWEFDAGFLVLQ
jgi:hypothetical protein